MQGCAYLYLPNAFESSGVVLGTFVVVGLATLLNITKDYLLQVQAPVAGMSPHVRPHPACAPSRSSPLTCLSPLPH